MIDADAEDFAGPQHPAMADDARPRGRETVVAHLSDLHLTDPGPFRLGHARHPKRLLAWLSWRSRRRARHDRDRLDRLVPDLVTADPDVVVVTGDLTHLGLPHEFEQTRCWLEALGSPSRVCVVPGNHDACCEEPWDATLGSLSPWFASDEVAAFPFPSLRVRGDVALIGVSTATPSPLFFATGDVGADQVARLGDMLRESGERGRFRIVYLHHPPTPGTVAWRKRLRDGRRLLEAVDAFGAELILHGHAHRDEQGSTPAAGRSIPVIGAPSASDSRWERGGGAYNLYRIARDGSVWTIDVEGRQLDGERVSVRRRRIEVPA